MYVTSNDLALIEADVGSDIGFLCLSPSACFCSYLHSAYSGRRVTNCLATIDGSMPSNAQLEIFDTFNRN